MGKLFMRWQVLLALLGLVAVWAILALNRTPAAADLPAPATPAAIATPTPPPAVGDCTAPVPLRDGVLVEGIVGAPLYPNPLLADANPVDRQIVDLVFDGLVALDASGLPQPALARSWTVADDGRTLTFALRDDVTWHDGAPFSARDVAFTYGLLQSPDVAHPDATLWQSVSITTPDDYTVQFVLAEPYAPFLAATARGILPAHLLADVTLDRLRDHPFNNRPIGTGPFVVADDWLARGALWLTPNPAYYDVAALYITRIEQRFYADEAARTAALAAGALDMLVGIAPEALPGVLGVPGMRLYTQTADRYSELLFNVGDAALPTAAVDVRQALALALDRPALVAGVLNGQGVTFDGPYLPTHWAYVPEMTARAYDPAAAADLLAAAGWTLDAGGTTRARTLADGSTQPLTLRLLRPATEAARQLADALAAQWGALGVNVLPQVVDPQALRAALTARDFDVALLTITPLSDPDLYDFWSQQAIVAGQNYGGWNDRRASEALEAGRQLWDPAARYPYYVAFARAFDAALPALPLYYHVWSVAVADRLSLADGGEAADLGYLVRPRDRFAPLAQWTLGFEQRAVPCTP